MNVFPEYGFNPDVFRSESYESHETGRLCLMKIKENLVDCGGVVRDFKNGEWSNYILRMNNLHPMAKELLKKIHRCQQKRLFPAAVQSESSCDNDWFLEAKESYNSEIISEGLFVSKPKYNSEKEPPDWLKRIDQIKTPESSIRFDRTKEEYLKQLRIPLLCANHFMFIDAHFDISKPRYQHMIDILKSLSDRTPAVLVDIHRVCYSGSGEHRNIYDNETIFRKFKESLGEVFREETGLKIKVFIWDDFHDRFFLTNYSGVICANGFDCDNRNVTWSRLSRKNRDDIENEFTPEYKKHHLHYSFELTRNEYL